VEDRASKPPSVCIIGLDDYPSLTGQRHVEMVGGENVQHVLLARAWRQLGMDVSIIVFAQGQPKVHDVGGIRAIACCSKQDGIPGLRFAYPRTTSLIAAMRLADTDIYYQSLAGYATGVTAWFCRRHAKRFVFRISSDAYCVPGQQLIRFYRDRKVYEYGLRRADLILAQTERQQSLLHANYGLHSELVNTVVEAPVRAALVKDVDVLWVANFRAVKRSDLVIDLARRLPKLNFLVVGGGREEYARRMRDAARVLTNLTFVGPVPYEDVGVYFDRARVFLNTSSLEGFPNTFLQAWIRGVPVVTFFDPDGLIAKHGLGVAARDLEHMTHALTELAAQHELRESIGRRAAAFSAESYSASIVASRSRDLFSALLSGDCGSPKDRCGAQL
ncbi:MAG TPA: glycosyltransferase family 4 protein, partial [Steroidobacter sp.]|nr:glycosyltransferase family 4 protein [Steroidobacter sp.]